MTEPSVEEIVTRIEACPYHDMEGGDLIDIPYVRMLESAVADCRALVASWRERGEALQAFARADKLRSLDPDAYDRLVGEIRASVATLTQADLAALSLRRGSTIPQWPSVEDAMSRIKVLVDPEVETDMAARDLIVVMRELGRVTAENVILKKALREIQARVMQLSVNDGLITSD